MSMCTRPMKKRNTITRIDHSGFLRVVELISCQDITRDGLVQALSGAGAGAGGRAHPGAGAGEDGVRPPG